MPEDMTEPDSGEPQTTADTQKMKDDDREALLPGAFPQTEDGEHTEQDNDGTDVMDILKAAGADIVDDASQKEEKKGFFSKLLDLFTEEDEEDEEENQLQLFDGVYDKTQRQKSILCRRLSDLLPELFRKRT